MMSGDARKPKPRASDEAWLELNVENEELVVFSAESPAARLHGLTPAEREVVALMLDGLSNEAIAKRRGAARRTVANQVAAVFRKLGVQSRGELSARVHEPPRTALQSDLDETSGTS